MSWTSVLIGGILLSLIGVTQLRAAETRYIASGNSPLTVRSGPGVEYDAVSRLPHGTEIVLHETRGEWANIASPQGELNGWVPQEYLSPEPPEPLENRGDMTPEQEQRRFARLQRKGVIALQRSGMPGLVVLTMNPLVWHRLKPHQQENFLRRAQQYFGGTVLEIHDRRNDALMARLTAMGDVEFPTPVPTPEPPMDDTVTPIVPAPSPDAGSVKPEPQQ